MKALTALLARDIRLAWRQGSTGGMVVAFFVIVVTLFPLGIGPELNILQRISVGVIWVAALLSCLLSLDRLFQADWEDGSLDLLALSPLPLELVVLAKCLAHWVTTALPLIIMAPVMALFLNMAPDAYLPLLAALVVGTPALSLIGAIGAALTVSLRRGGVLVSLLVLPLYIPVLIFGVSVIEAAASGLDPTPHLLILGAITLGAMVLGPWASAAALRLGLE